MTAAFSVHCCPLVAVCVQATMDLGAMILITLLLSLLLNFGFLYYAVFCRSSSPPRVIEGKADSMPQESSSSIRNRSNTLPSKGHEIIVFPKHGQVYHHLACKHVKAAKDQFVDAKAYSACRDCFKWIRWNALRAHLKCDCKPVTCNEVHWWMEARHLGFCLWEAKFQSPQKSEKGDEYSRGMIRYWPVALTFTNLFHMLVTIVFLYVHMILLFHLGLNLMYLSCDALFLFVPFFVGIRVGVSIL